MPRRTCCLTLLLASVFALPAAADDDVTRLLKQVQAAGPEGAGSPEARAAWDRLVARGPAVLLPLLEAMDTPDTVVANWLRTAFDRISEKAAFEVLARNDVGESVVASPALSRGCLFLRGDRHLYCIGEPAHAGEDRGERSRD
jgi:hypothetical protein